MFQTLLDNMPDDMRDFIVKEFGILSAGSDLEYIIVRIMCHNIFNIAFHNSAGNVRLIRVRGAKHEIYNSDEKVLSKYWGRYILDKKRQILYNK